MCQEIHKLGERPPEPDRASGTGFEIRHLGLAKKAAESLERGTPTTVLVIIKVPIVGLRLRLALSAWGSIRI